MTSIMTQMVDIHKKSNLTLYSLLVTLGSLIALLSLSNLDTIYASHLDINTTKLTDNMYVIYGSGGNVIVSIGIDGIIMVDDQYAPVTEKMKSVIAELSDQPIKFVINTHWHPDHFLQHDQDASEYLLQILLAGH